MTAPRPMAHAGRFYPADPGCLQKTIALHLNRARSSYGSPRVIIAPHAGWRYCAPVLGTAFRAVAGLARVDRLLLVGPSHYDPIAGIVTTDSPAFETPFGPMPVDLTALAGIPVDAQAHAKEHALEVHLPFLRLLFPDSAITPLLIGETAPEGVADHLMALGCGEGGVLTVISSDLAHYLPVDRLRVTDRDTLRRIEAGAYGDLGTERACAAPALRGLGVVAERIGLRAAALDLSDSYAITGENPANAVGYAAIAYFNPPAARSER